jgi:Glycine zipper 2TM domain
MKYLFLLIMIASVLTACNSGAEKAAAAQKEKQKTIDSLNTALVKQKVIDSMKLVQAKTVKKNTQVTQTSENMESTTSQPAKKKGLSHTAKGAIVGAGTGAITGAIINHDDRVKGAAIGTIIGAGIGAGTGLIVDKSVKKKKKKAATVTRQ